MKKSTITHVLAFAFMGYGLLAQAHDFTHDVNPFIGASTSIDAAGVLHGLGKTFPGAATPFGAVQVSPNTITGGDNGPGYSYEHKTIEGFAMTQMSGIGWYGDLGNFLVMPTTGTLHKIAGREDGSLQGYRSSYSKESESARAGYYSVMLDRYHIQAEATATPHCGLLRFTYPRHDQSRIQIDLARRVGGTSTEQYIHILDAQTIEGWMRCTPEGGGWGDGAGKGDYTVYFHARLSKPMQEHGIWSADIPEGCNRKRESVVSTEYQKRVAEAPLYRDATEMQGKHLGFYAGFSTQENEAVELKVGISYVDLSGARHNFDQEVRKLSFRQALKKTQRLWNKALSAISIEGGSPEDRTIFYTALYHTLIDPREYADCDGRYIGGDKQVHETSTFRKRTIFSGWDVFRSQFPLLTIINPAVVSDMINSLVTLADESGNGYYERWEFLNAYSGCMVGHPAISVLADAYAKGIRTYDVERAYQLAVSTSRKFGNDPYGYTPGRISETLEYTYTDWCIAQLAKALGHEQDAQEFQAKSMNYKNIFRPDAEWFCPRNADGSWQTWTENSLTQGGFGCVESNPLQQGWFVPHDVAGLSALLGGREKTLARLTEFMEKAPSDFYWNDYYNHANEPVHQVPYMFNQLGSPSQTQYWTRFICSHAYHNKVEGLVGNEDVGQMSAWYVLSACGLHPSCPGDGRMEITSPVFDKIVFHLDSNYYKGKTFTVIAHNNSPANVYIQSIRLNGKDYDHTWIDFADIARGGTLELFMGANPR